MENQIRKLKSLLRFYKRDGTKIELKVSYGGGITVSGIVTKMNLISREWITLQSDSGASMKIFLEDIEPNSIILPEFVKKENKKENKQATRSPISDKLRFEVFKRDKYVCQYCGACGPDVELEVDHVIPVSRGGTDDIDNLKTSCFRCNRGKGDKV